MPSIRGHINPERGDLDVDGVIHPGRDGAVPLALRVDKPHLLRREQRLHLLWRGRGGEVQVGRHDPCGWGG